MLKNVSTGVYFKVENLLIVGSFNVAVYAFLCCIMWWILNCYCSWQCVCMWCKYYMVPCRLRGCKNGSVLFPGRMSYKESKSALVFVLYLSMFFGGWCLLGLLFMYCYFSLYVFCIVVVVVKLSLLVELLAR